MAVVSSLLCSRYLLPPSLFLLISRHHLYSSSSLAVVSSWPSSSPFSAIDIPSSLPPYLETSSPYSSSLAVVSSGRRLLWLSSSPFSAIDISSSLLPYLETSSPYSSSLAIVSSGRRLLWPSSSPFSAIDIFSSLPPYLETSSPYSSSLTVVSSGRRLLWPSSSPFSARDISSSLSPYLETSSPYSSSLAVVSILPFSRFPLLFRLLSGRRVIFVHDLSQRRPKASLQKWAAEVTATGTFSTPLGSGGPGGLPVPYIVIDGHEVSFTYSYQVSSYRLTADVESLAWDPNDQNSFVLLATGSIDKMGTTHSFCWTFAEPVVRVFQIFVRHDAYLKDAKEQLNAVEAENAKISDDIKLLELDHQIEKKRNTMSFLEDRSCILKRIEAVGQIEDMFTGIKVVDFDGSEIRLSLETFIPTLDDFFSQQKMVFTSNPPTVNHELFIKVYGTLELKNVEDSIGRYYCQSLKCANETIGTTTDELVLKAAQGHTLHLPARQAER
ncbi:hypothetical protein IFM89_028938 [Coptis chinensis]|uniref:Uncharacterized protein n=1 Tax=Coptis chinensis TaxID=261450 RepID=A0A835LP14_9MAGN|nr:hypothetical protein IFM89_028938 [Coptis chinensis]